MVVKLLPYFAMAAAIGASFFIKHLCIKAANRNEGYGWDIRLSFILFSISVGLICTQA
jgi:hypothetical protein